MCVCVREGSRSHRVYAWRPEAGMVVSLPPALFIEGGRVSHVVWLDSLLLGPHLTFMLFESEASHHSTFGRHGLWRSGLWSSLCNKCFFH